MDTETIERPMKGNTKSIFFQFCSLAGGLLIKIEVMIEKAPNIDVIYIIITDLRPQYL